MRVPLRARAHHARGQSRRREGILEVPRLPGRYRRRHRLARALAAEELHGAIAVVRHVGVDLYPAPVARLVEAEYGIAAMDVLLLCRAQVALAAEGGHGGPEIHADGLGPSRPRAPDLGGGQGAGPDDRGGGGADLEVGGQDRIGAGEADALECGRVAARQRPQLPQGGRALRHPAGSPALTARTWPDTLRAMSLQKKTVASTMSSAVTMRLRGERSTKALRICSTEMPRTWAWPAMTRSMRSPSTAPGATQLTRMLCSASSRAMP